MLSELSLQLKMDVSSNGRSVEKNEHGKLRGLAVRVIKKVLFSAVWMNDFLYAAGLLHVSTCFKVNFPHSLHLAHITCLDEQIMSKKQDCPSFHFHFGFSTQKKKKKSHVLRQKDRNILIGMSRKLPHYSFKLW